MDEDETAFFISSILSFGSALDSILEALTLLLAQNEWLFVSLLNIIMIKVLITGAGSYVGESVRKYILSTSYNFEIDAVDTMGDNWKNTDYSPCECGF